MIVNKSIYPVGTGFGTISGMQARLTSLQKQLGSGEKASNLAELGHDLPLSLSVRERLNTIEGYKSNIDKVNLRLRFLGNAMTRFDKIEEEGRKAATPGQYGTGGINMATVPGLSKARFEEIVTILNQEVAGRYLFGGKTVDRPPLEEGHVLMDGKGGKKGYKAVTSDRALADGVSGYGRLVPGSPVPGTVTLANDGNPTFGFKVSTVSTTAPSTAVTVVQPSGTPPELSVTFAGTLTAGQTVTIGLSLPDGTETSLTLAATNSSSPGAGEFQVDADSHLTAANFKMAMEDGLIELSHTELRAASAYAAATDFFSADGIPKVPAGGSPPTTLADASTSDVIFWYKGGKDADPRASVTAVVEDGSPVRYGMQANESGFLNLIRSQAAMGIAYYPSEESVREGPAHKANLEAAMNLPEGPARDVKLQEYEDAWRAEYRLSTRYFDGMATRQQEALSEAHNSESGSIEFVTMELGNVAKRLETASKRHKDYEAQLIDILADIEVANKDEVIMEMLALQTRLQASYQTTVMVAQLSLVHYLR